MPRYHFDGNEFWLEYRFSFCNLLLGNKKLFASERCVQNPLRLCIYRDTQSCSYGKQSSTSFNTNMGKLSELFSVRSNSRIIS